MGEAWGAGIKSIVDNQQSVQYKSTSIKTLWPSCTATSSKDRWMAILVLCRELYSYANMLVSQLMSSKDDNLLFTNGSREHFVEHFLILSIWMFGKLLSLREVWMVNFCVQTILMSVWSTKPLATVLWKHKSCLFSSHFFFMLLIMPSLKTALLEEYHLQILSIVSLCHHLWLRSLKQICILRLYFLLCATLLWMKCEQPRHVYA